MNRDTSSIWEMSNSFFKRAEKAWDEGADYVVNILPDKIPSPLEMDLWKADIEAKGGSVKSMEIKPIVELEDSDDAGIGDTAIEFVLSLPSAIANFDMYTTIANGTEKVAQDAMAAVAPTVKNGIKSVIDSGAEFTGLSALSSYVERAGAAADELLEQAEDAEESFFDVLAEFGNILKWSVIGSVALLIVYLFRGIIFRK